MVPFNENDYSTKYFGDIDRSYLRGLNILSSVYDSDNKLIQKTEKELKSIKHKNILAYTATGLAFILSAIAIVVASKGFDTTVDFVQKLLSGT